MEGLDECWVECVLWWYSPKKWNPILLFTRFEMYVLAGLWGPYAVVGTDKTGGEEANRATPATSVLEKDHGVGSGGCTIYLVLYGDPYACRVYSESKVMTVLWDVGIWMGRDVGLEMVVSGSAALKDCGGRCREE